ncbi:MAG: GGDEF domain-containing protein [Cellulosilyticaceae bacterium]
MLYSTEVNIPTLGVILGNLEDPCQSKILSGLAQYAKKHAMHLLTYVGTTFDETNQYLPNYSLLNPLMGSIHFDALIVMTGAISSLISIEEIESFTLDCAHIPILSISSPLDGCTNLLIDNESGIRDIICHLINEHGCKHFAFVCGTHGHTEADARLLAFKHTLAHYGLPIESNLIFPGDFSEGAGRAAVDALLASGRPLPDAIICVDDSTAYGVLRALKAHHIHVPESVYVTGFDDAPGAKNCSPALTTISQPFYELGLKAGEIAMDLIHNKRSPQDFSIPTELIVRESCGCTQHQKVDPTLYLALTNHLTPYTSWQEGLLAFIMLYISEKEPLSEALIQSLRTLIEDILHTIQDDTLSNASAFWLNTRNQLLALTDRGITLDIFYPIISLITEYAQTQVSNRYQVMYFSQRFFVLLADLQTAVTQALYREDSLYLFKLRQISQKLITCFNTSAVFKAIQVGLKDLGIQECHIVLFDDSNAESHFFKLAFSCQNGIVRPIEKSILFSSTTLLPDFIKLQTAGSNHIVLPLLTEHHTFGYMICQYNEWLHHSVFETLRSHISSGLHGALLYEKEKYSQDLLSALLTQLEERNIELQHSSVQDELTGLYNRRGFMDIAGNKFEQLTTCKEDALLFFMDLDGLKIINDSYGHQEGDFALIQMAQLLTHTFQDLGCIARLSGDEFTVFVPHYSAEWGNIFTNQLHTYLSTYNQQSNKPYELSVSIGVASAKENPDISFRELLNIADFELYKKKQARYATKEKRT